MGLCSSKIFSLLDCKKQSSAAASVIGSNVDMLTQILLRLPVKSLLVFKSVSKLWFSIISDPFFIKKFNNLQNALSIQGLYTQTIPRSIDISPKLDYVPLDGSSSFPPFKTLSFVDHPVGIEIMQSCNGLMCCAGCCGHEVVYRTYYICNPSTRQYFSIACESQKYEKGFEKLLSVNLAYDPVKSPHYKVVCIWYVSTLTNYLFNYQIEIYSSETASWKLSGEVFAGPGNFYFDSGVFWNGSLHWIDRFERGSFLYFDVDRELLKEIDMPFCDKELGIGAKNLVECKGRLYVTLSRVSSPTSFEIFEMKTHYTGWNKRYLVNLQELLIAYPRFELKVSYEFDVLLVKEVEGESPNLVLRVLDRVFSYDLRDMSFKEIQQLGLGEIKQLGPGYLHNVFHQYIETLARV